MVPSGLIFIWTGTHAGIPSGWSRVTALDTKYALGAGSGEDGGGTGGATTHTHTVVDHSHSLGNHHHSIAAANASAFVSSDGGPVNANFPAHNHTSKNSNSASVTSNSASVTFDSKSNDPPYVEVIFIESDGTPVGLPDNATALWEDSGSTPTSWNENDGAGGRLDLRNRFLKGAATAGDAGGTGGSLDSHSHAETGGNHSHTVPTHNHGTTPSNLSTAFGGSFNGAPGGGVAETRHFHDVTLNNDSSLALNAGGSAVDTQNADGQPPFTMLQAIQNETGGEDLPSGLVGLWLSTIAAIPTDWTLMDGVSTTVDMRDRFLKGKSSGGAIGDVGGSANHTHTANSHNHSVAGATHTHGYSAGIASARSNEVFIFEDQQVSAGSHTHTWTIGNASPTVTSAAVVVTVNTAVSYPEYVKALFLKYTPAAVDEERGVHTMHIGLGLSRL